MRIQPHTDLTLEPARTSPATRQAGSLTTTGATKPAADSFTNLFQAMSISSTSSVNRSGAPSATRTAGTTESSPAATATSTTATSATSTTSATTPAATATASTTEDGSTTTVQPPGIQALVSAIMNGSFQATNITNSSQLQETTPAGTATMPNFYYASDQTANQLASLLGGTVVQMPPFGQELGFNAPLANFIQLPNGQTFNAADVAYYAKAGSEGGAQLTADLTQTINEGAAWTNYYQNGGQMPSFPTGYVGPPISGMNYPVGSIGADGNVINPAMQGVNA